MLEKALKRLLEDDLESQLDVEGFARSDARRIIARPDGRRGLSKTAGAERVIPQLRRSWVGQIHTIE